MIRRAFVQTQGVFSLARRQTDLHDLPDAEPALNACHCRGTQRVFLNSGIAAELPAARVHGLTGRTSNIETAIPALEKIRGLSSSQLPADVDLKLMPEYKKRIAGV
ncbi:MAG: hypothetical protein JWQ71_3990 [Pedosphaera sp.]|nr:hypothetical protein [Pedosphaera sp.]